jgi:hypothetical protein
MCPIFIGQSIYINQIKFDRGGPLHVQAFLHAVLFPIVRLLDVHPQQTRGRTLTVVVTHPGANAHNCSLTSSSDHTTIYPLLVGPTRPLVLE